MTEQIPLLYAEWNDSTGQPSEPLAKVLVSQGILFLRKLVNATVIHNYIWEHTSHERDGEQAFIFVKPLDPVDQPLGSEMKEAVFSRHDVSGQYEVEYWELDHLRCQWLDKQTFERSLEAAQILLDHYLHHHGVHFEVTYTILDPARKKVLVFLQRTEFNSQ